MKVGNKKKAGKGNKRKAGKGKGGKRKGGKGKGKARKGGKKARKGKKEGGKRKAKKGDNSKRKDSKKADRKKNKKGKKSNRNNSDDDDDKLFINNNDSCGTDVTKALACHDTAVDYLKLLKGKVCEKQAPYSVQKHDKAKKVVQKSDDSFQGGKFREAEEEDCLERQASSKQSR